MVSGQVAKLFCPFFVDRNGVTAMRTNGYFEFLTYFVDLEDPRADRGKNHSLLDMVGLVLCGTICGADTWADIERFARGHLAWFEEFLELPYGVPSHDTFARVFSILDPEQLQQCLAAWVQHLQFCLDGETVAIDGKTLRGSHDKAAGQKPLHANHSCDPAREIPPLIIDSIGVARVSVSLWP